MDKEQLDIPENFLDFIKKPTHQVVTSMRPTGPVQINVYIEYNLPEHKPFLGGFQNRTTGQEFHNVAGQTALLPHQRGLDKLIDKFHRGVQTQVVQHNQVQTARESGFQTPFFHDFLKTPYRLIEAKPYILASEEMQKREIAALSIQRVVRGFFARRLVAQMKLEILEEKRQMEEQEKRVQEELERKRNLAILKRKKPRTAADFRALYEELEAWHFQQTIAINEGGYPEEERKRLLLELLQKETEFLHTIDKMKIEASKVNSDSRIQADLDSISKKKLWQMTNGEVIAVRTPGSQRAKELRNIYNALNDFKVTVDERIELLLKTKQTVKEFNTQLTQDLISLIDREADLLNRGRPDPSLSGLRQRISTLFLQFVKTPEFNADAALIQS